jgi:hypothetical protein
MTAYIVAASFRLVYPESLTIEHARHDATAQGTNPASGSDISIFACASTLSLGRVLLVCAVPLVASLVNEG